MKILLKNISLLFFFLILVFLIPQTYAYDCYSASNAGTVAPDNGSVCANMYIVPSTSGAGAKKLKNATHSGSNAYIYGGVRYYLGEVTGEKKVFTGQVVNFNRVFIIRKV